MKSRAWIEVSAHNLRHNVRTLCSALPEGCQLMAVVKANAYGHGAVETALLLEDFGVQAFAVATVDEGITLRKAGVRSEILVLGYTAPQRACALSNFGLTQTLVDYDHAIGLALEGHPISAHIKVDTGMHRLGFAYTDIGKIEACFSLRCVSISGIYSHLCVSDSLREGDVEFTKAQITRFGQVLRELRTRGLPAPKAHLQSSYGLLNYPELKYDYVRVGVALYGVYSVPDAQTKLRLDLRPVLSLKSRIVHISTVPVGDTVGYGRCFTAHRECRIAAVPVGYADGIPRGLSNGGGQVLVKGKQVPIVGRVCMDQLTVDITDIPDAGVGDEVTVIGSGGTGEQKAEELAHMAGTITNDLLSGMGSRLPVIVKE